jgi:hypothetical protein
MRLNTFLSLGLLLALASTSALGFQEQNGDVVAPGAAQAVETPADAALAPGAAAKPAAAGTEVRIPGLGKLGILPKMDFGLELLYGASEPKPSDEDREVPTDDLTIRGSIKHPF